MKTTSADYIWGIPRQPTASRRAEYLGLEAMHAPTNVKRALKSFLNAQIKAWRPEVMIVIERKGTAVLRSLMEGNEPINWQWGNVISSKVLKDVDPAKLVGKRILVFDDMMKRGLHVEDLLSDLKQLGVDVSSPDAVRVAVFGVHEDSSVGREVHGTIIPHAWYRRGLNTTDYAEVRAEIVEMLQRSGSLMLDTEHLEVRVNVTGSFEAFVSALRRTGNAVVFTSAGERVNITVLYEDDEIHLLPDKEFPEGTNSTNIVKKCRVVQRSGSEFALIPICFPAIRAHQRWNCNRDITTLFGRSFEETTDIPRFYAVGMRAALRVLRWVLKDLYAAASQDFTVSLPGCLGDVRDGNGYHLAHLGVMYPTLDLDYLNKWIARIEHEARSEGGRLPARVSVPPVMIAGDDLRDRATALLQRIADVLDRKRIRSFWHSRPLDIHPFGLTASEIFEIGKEFGWEKVVTSTLFDVLIDEATLVTHVQLVKDANGSETIQRTFEPDGELVNEAVRRYTMQWGLPDAKR